MRLSATEERQDAGQWVGAGLKSTRCGRRPRAAQACAMAVDLGVARAASEEAATASQHHHRKVASGPAVVCLDGKTANGPVDPLSGKSRANGGR